MFKNFDLFGVCYVAKRIVGGYSYLRRPRSTLVNHLWIVRNKFIGMKGNFFYDTRVILGVASFGTHRITTCAHQIQ
jgi:hypothetical protein